MQVAGETVIDRGISRFADGVADYRPVWSVIEDDFYAQVTDQFKTEGAEGGEKWPALSPAYAGWKEIHFPGMPILQRTGALQASLTSRTDANAVVVEERKHLTLGSRIGYGVYHQSTAPRTRLPRRPPIVFTEAFKRGVMHHIQVYLVQIASQSGFRTGLGPLDVGRIAASRSRTSPAGSSRDAMGRFQKRG